MTEVEAEVFLSTLRALLKNDNRFKSKKKLKWNHSLITEMELRITPKEY